ncbi:beta strand repeat-containing protein [Scytonema sp. NUACC26]|uniref:beta strand repeat-containing protein n=1 Tax=Scytonema sp. NUACC26 TaxID=3140176 RepID=UPI0034DC420C
MVSRSGSTYSWWWSLAEAITTLGAILGFPNIALAQITPDTTLGADNSTVTRDVLIRGILGDRIDGGATRGTNLFHSFEEFNIGVQRGAYFSNSTGIENIFSRVTGNNPSNILGRLGVLGNANLFFINPNGIIFGQNASLDVSGSFFATTANAIQFAELGFFSASNPEAPKLLTINPSAFLFSQISTGTIINNSNAPAGLLPSGFTVRGLRVPDGQNLLLLGGNVGMSGGLKAFGGHVEIGAVAGPGTVALNSDGSLRFPIDIPRADVSLSRSQIDVAAGNGGSVSINARNIGISSLSFIRAGVRSGVGTVDSLAGNITLNSTGTLEVKGLSSVENASEVGNSGNIDITTDSLSLTNAGILSTSTFGQGNAGNITINARNQVSLDGGNLGSLASAISSNVEKNAFGQGGEVRVTTGSLSLTKGAQLRANTSGQGKAGNIIIEARDRVSLDNAYISSIIEQTGNGMGGNVQLATNELFLNNLAGLLTSTVGQGDAGNIAINARARISLDTGSVVYSRVQSKAMGNGGSIDITTGSLSVSNGAQLSASILGQGNAGSVRINTRDRISLDGKGSIISSRLLPGGIGKGGSIEITTGSLSLTNGSQLSTGTFGQGNAGNVTIVARDNISVDRTSADGSPSGIFSTVESGAVGDGGTLEIATGSLSLSNKAALSASTLGQGKAGDVIITARDHIALDTQSVIRSRVEPGAVGNGGSIEITAGSVSVSNGVQLSTGTFGQGDAGNVRLSALDYISIDGSSPERNPSGIFSTVEQGAEGNGGNIDIATGSLFLTNKGQLSALTSSRGKAGNVNIAARDLISLDGSSIGSSVAPGGIGDGGNIAIATGSFFSTNQGTLLANTFDRGNAGNVIISARDDVSLKNSYIFSGVLREAIGNGGNIEITTSSFSLNKGALLASTAGQGDAGDVTIAASDRISIDGASAEGQSIADISSNVQPGAIGDGGNIKITTGSLFLNNQTQLFASTLGRGDAGKVIITARDRIALDGGDVFSSVLPGAVGNGGNIEIATGSLSLTNGAVLSATTFGQGNAGNVAIQSRNSVSLDGVDTNGVSSGIFTDTDDKAQGQSGNIAITTDSFRVTNGASVNARTANTERGGDIVINANTFEAINGGQIVTTTASSGRAGNVTLNVQDRITLSGWDRTFARRLEQFRAVTINEGRGESGLFASTLPNSTGDGGTITLQTNTLSLTDRSQISTSSLGTGNAGDIAIAARQSLSANNSDITTSATNSSGGEMRISAKDVRLFGDSDIRTDVASGENQGGNITITADSIIAFDDSDILAFARDGRGGDINLNTRAFFGSGYQPAQRATNPQTLDGNNRVDVNATGGIASGKISTPDDSSIQNSLSELSENPIDTNALIANSCIARSRSKLEGKFTITGSGGLPNRPGDVFISSYTTGDIRNVTVDSRSRLWQKGDPIVEPSGVYRLPSGKLILSRECS